MSDPISSSIVPSSTCNFDDDPALACQASPPPTNASPNSCESPELPPPLASSIAASDLAQKFLTTNHGPLLAASTPKSPMPSAPPALTVKSDQVDFQTGMPRLESHSRLGNLSLHAGVDILNVNAHAGARNEDGSYGVNVGWGANLLAGELTLDYKGWSLSVGAAVSEGGSIASGEGRDIDKDGIEERCFKMTLGAFTIGECDEL